MDTGSTLEGVQGLLRSYLTRDNLSTLRNYEAVLEDFRRYAKAPSVEAALLSLLASGPQKADEKIARYKALVIGKRDQKGRLTRGRGLSSSAVNLRLTVLRSLIKKARRTGMIQWELDVPNLAHELVHDVRGPGDELLNKMLAKAKERPGAEGRRDYAIVRLAAELGLRRREIVGLDLEDLDVAGSELKIRGKGRREKESVACSAKTIEAIQQWIQMRPKPREGSALFTNLIPGRAGRISGPAVYLIVRGLGKAALPSSRRKIGPHKIRHTAITSAVRLAKANGLAREEVQKFSRHKDFRMVARYIDADDRAQAILANANGARLA